MKVILCVSQQQETEAIGDQSRKNQSHQDHMTECGCFFPSLSFKIVVTEVLVLALGEHLAKEFSKPGQDAYYRNCELIKDLF